MPRFVRQLALVAIVTSALVNTALCDQIMLDDFNSPPIFAAEVDGTSQYNTWIPTSAGNQTTLGTVTTAEGNICLKYMDIDSVGSARNPSYSNNGVYKIIPNAFPETGSYVVRMRFRIFDAPLGVNNNSYLGFGIGYTVNGGHRAQGQSLTALTSTQFTYVPNHLSSNKDDTPKPFTEVISSSFSANAGDSLRVVLSSASDFYNYHNKSYTDAYIIIEDLRLQKAVEVPVALSAWTLE